MRKYQVILPSDPSDLPEKHEISAAAILANHFHTDVKFVKRTNHKTADLLIQNRYWEIKSPTGKGKHNIQHQLQNAVGQSPNAVLDARRSKMHMRRFISEAKYQFKIIARLKNLLVITKLGEVLEIKKEV